MAAVAMQTPPFIVWALARRCHLRQITLWEDAERTERLLRAARAYDEARAEGRIVDGIAIAAGAEHETDVEQVHGFRVDSALELYGGIARLHAACDDCPANTLRGHKGREVVGCFGMWPLPETVDGLCQQVEELASPTGTSPRWYGLWLRAPIVGDEAARLAAILRRLSLDDPLSSPGRDELLLALAVAARGEFSLHFRHYPPGNAEGGWWNLVPHCEICQAPWTGEGRCRVCGLATHPASPKKRRIRGQRPYYPLVRLLGAERTAEHLVRYCEHRPASLRSLHGQ
jgi:hypothetical protein